MTFSWFWAGGDAGAWSVLRILLVIDDLLVVFGGQRRWGTEHPENPYRNRRPSRGFGRGGGAAAWGVLKILFVIDNPLVVLGAALALRASSESCS